MQLFLHHAKAEAEVFIFSATGRQESIDHVQGQVLRVLARIFQGLGIQAKLHCQLGDVLTGVVRRTTGFESVLQHFKALDGGTRDNFHQVEVSDRKGVVVLSDGAQLTQQLIVETVEEELDGIAIIVFVVGVISCKLGSYCLDRLATFQTLMLLDTRNHLGGHSGIRQVTNCIQAAVLQVGPDFIPEDLQVIVTLELWVETFDAVGPGLLCCPHRATPILIGAGRSRRGALQTAPKVAWLASSPSNHIPGGNGVQTTHNWCAGRMSGSCSRVGCWGRLLESGDQGGSQLLRGERRRRRPGGRFLSFSLHPFFDSLYCFIRDRLRPVVGHFLNLLEREGTAEVGTRRVLGR